MSNNLPAVGSKVHSQTGPSMYMNGQVITHVTNRWGTHALVLMFNGKINTCNGLNTRPGIGWHAGHSILGDVDTDAIEFDYSNYD